MLRNVHRYPPVTAHPWAYLDPAAGPTPSANSRVVFAQTENSRMPGSVGSSPSSRYGLIAKPLLRRWRSHRVWPRVVGVSVRPPAPAGGCPGRRCEWAAGYGLENPGPGRPLPQSTLARTSLTASRTTRASRSLMGGSENPRLSSSVSCAVMAFRSDAARASSAACRAMVFTLRATLSSPSRWLTVLALAAVIGWLGFLVRRRSRRLGLRLGACRARDLPPARPSSRAPPGCLDPKPLTAGMPGSATGSQPIIRRVGRVKAADSGTRG